MNARRKQDSVVYVPHLRATAATGNPSQPQRVAREKHGDHAVRTWICANKPTSSHAMGGSVQREHDERAVCMYICMYVSSELWRMGTYSRHQPSHIMVLEIPALLLQ